MESNNGVIKTTRESENLYRYRPLETTVMLA